MNESFRVAVLVTAVRRIHTAFITPVSIQFAGACPTDATYSADAFTAPSLPFQVTFFMRIIVLGTNWHDFFTEITGICHEMNVVKMVKRVMTCCSARKPRIQNKSFCRRSSSCNLRICSRCMTCIQLHDWCMLSWHKTHTAGGRPFHIRNKTWYTYHISRISTNLPIKPVLLKIS